MSEVSSSSDDRLQVLKSLAPELVDKPVKSQFTYVERDPNDATLLEGLNKDRDEQLSHLSENLAQKTISEQLTINQDETVYNSYLDEANRALKEREEALEKLRSQVAPDTESAERPEPLGPHNGPLEASNDGEAEARVSFEQGSSDSYKDLVEGKPASLPSDGIGAALKRLRTSLFVKSLLEFFDGRLESSSWSAEQIAQMKNALPNLATLEPSEAVPKVVGLAVDESFDSESSLKEVMIGLFDTSVEADPKRVEQLSSVLFEAFWTWATEKSQEQSEGQDGDTCGAEYEYKRMLTNLTGHAVLADDAYGSQEGA